MPEPIITLSLLLSAAAGGMAEAIVGRAADKAPNLVSRAKALLSQTQALPASTAEVAVRKAVDAARQDMLLQIAQGDLSLAPNAVGDLVALLNHPPFAESVASKLLVAGQPDWERLRLAWDAQGGDSDRWQALQPALFDLLEAIQQHLSADPDLGPLLRDLAKLSQLTNLTTSNQVIADASREIAVSSAAGAVTLAELLALSGRQAATLGEIKTLLAQMAQRPAPRAAAAVSTGVALTPDERAYLNSLRERCNRLPLADDRRRQDPGQPQARVELARVYVDLRTTAEPPLSLVFERLQVPAAERPRLLKTLRQSGVKGATGRLPIEAPEAAELTAAFLARPGERDDFEKHPLRPWAKDAEALQAAFAKVTALEALAQPGACVLLGKPGSGKSTLVNHLALTLAGAWLGTEPDWAAMLHNQFPAPLFPLRVILRRWSADLTKHSRAGRSLAYDALAVATEIRDRRELLQRLDRSDTLVLFDGLDEVPVPDPDSQEPFDRRRLIVDSVGAFIAAHPTCRVLVTSRVKPYQNEPVYQLPGLATYELADLDTPRVERFIGLWYDELVRVGRVLSGRAAELRQRLLQALALREILREMAGTPLLLTMLTQVNAWAGLPESRAHLYHDCVEQLLWEWEKEKREGAEGASSLRNLDDLLQEIVEQYRQPATRKHIEHQLWELTFDAHGQSGRQTADLAAVDLEKRLAPIHPGRHQAKAWASRVVELMQTRGGLLVETETGHFSFPHRSFQEYLAACGLLQQVNRVGKVAELASSENWTEVVLLACGELNRRGDFRDTQTLVQELARPPFLEPNAWRRLLVAGQAWLEFGPQNALDASGRELRENLPFQLTDLMQEVYVPAAQRLAAGLLAADLGLRPADLHARIPIVAQSILGYDFRIGKYPVTNSQFQDFITAGGYDQRQPWWDKEEIEEIMQYWVEWPAGPRYWDNPRFNRATQPVVGVSWYEAGAYCDWLTAELRQRGEIGQGDMVRLPTEAEWARVAAGADRRPYP